MSKSPYTTITAGTTILSSWANANVRSQGFPPFPSTSARDSAIVTPVVGQVAYISSNDVNEGFTFYNSANKWARDWNEPWGQVASAERDIGQSGIGTTFTDITGMSVTFTAVTNRRYRVNCWAEFANPNAVLQVVPEFRLVSGDAVTLYQNAAFRMAVSESHFVVPLLRTITTLTNGSVTLKLQAKASNATTIDINTGDGEPTCMYVSDVGPSGAPA